MTRREVLELLAEVFDGAALPLPIEGAADGDRYIPYELVRDNIRRLLADDSPAALIARLTAGDKGQ